MYIANRSITAVLCFCILNLTFVTGCATSGFSRSPARDTTETAEVAPEGVEAEYVEYLREKPPEDLTLEEIAYLEMVAEQKQADSLGTITGLALAGFGIGLLGAAVTIIVLGGS